MRIICILILIASVSCKSALKQVNVDSPSKEQSHKSEASKKSLLEYKGDTLQYLNSLVSIKQNYIGKKLDVLLKDLDLEVKSYSYNIPFRPNTHCTSISLEFYDKDAVSNKIYTRTPYQFLNVEWASPLPTTEEVNKFFVDNKDEGWGKKHIVFFGKFLVKDITAYTFNDPVKQAKQ